METTAQPKLDPSAVQTPTRLADMINDGQGCEHSDCVFLEHNMDKILEKFMALQYG